MKMKLFNKNRDNSKNHRNSLLHSMGRDAYVDWALSFAFNVCLAIALIAFSYYIFVSTSSLDVPSAAVVKSTKRTLLDEKQLNKTINVFVDREIERRNLEQGYGGAGDPSL